MVDGSAWRFFLVETPDKSGVGVNEVIFAVRDREGAQVAVSDAIYVVDTNDPPQTPLLATGVVGGAVAFEVDGTDDLDSLLTLR